MLTKKRELISFIIMFITIFALSFSLSKTCFIYAGTSINGVTASVQDCIFNGKNQHPTVTLKKGKTVLKLNKDYKVVYKDNFFVGTGKAIITGKGKYTGTITKTFKIKERKTVAHRNNGTLLREKNLTNNILIIGDSRIVQMHDYGYKASYVCIWGGHYYGNGNYDIRNRKYNNKTNKQIIKEYINDIVKKHGSCKVVIESTINDYLGKGTDKYYQTRNKALTDVINFATEISGYNSKAKVYITSLIRAQEGFKSGKIVSGTVAEYNTDLKTRLSKNKKITYLGITPAVIHYDNDKLHLKDDTLCVIYNVIKSAK